MKIRRSTPIFQTVRQASPSDRGGRWRRGVVQRGGLAALGGQHLLTQLDLLVATSRGLAQAQADDHDDHDGYGEEEERGTPGEDGGQPGAEEDTDDRPDADAGAVGRIDPRPGRDRVVVGQQ
jgi:hypothetical protein